MKIKKILSVLCAVMIFSSSVLSVGAVDTTYLSENVPAYSEETVSDEVVEETTEESTSAETEESFTTETAQALEPINVSKETVTEKTKETEPTEITRKKGFTSYSAGASITAVSSGATVTTEKEFTGTNGARKSNGTYVDVLRTITYYDRNSSAPYVYKDTDGVSHPKAKKIVIECGNIKAVWDVDESSLSSKTSDDGTGTLSVRSSDNSTGNWFEPTDGESAQKYTPWGVSMGNSRITKLEIYTNIVTIGLNSFRGLNNLNTLTCLDGGKLATIGISSFRNCSSLKTIYFTNNPIKTIGDMAFRGCNKLEISKVYSSNGNNVTATIPSGVLSGTYANILTIPDTLRTIGEEAFLGCKSIEGISYVYDPVEWTTIGISAFRNCTRLHFINIPDYMTTIEELAFSTALKDSDGTLTASSKVLYISSEWSKLKKIGDKAFFNDISQTDIEDGNIPNGVRVYDKENGEVKASDSNPFIFYHLTYMGENAFRNNISFKGKYLFAEYCNIKARAFSYTKLTNLYCRYNRDEKYNSQTQKINSSQVGSSHTYVSTENNFAIKSKQEITVNGIKYHSLYHILQQNIEKWQFSFSSIGNQMTPYEDWTSIFAVDENGNLVLDKPKSKDSNCPELSYGENNDKEKINPNKGNQTTSYLKTETEWISGQEEKKATETVTFGYKNLPKVDYVFVVDNSPSMDSASSESGASYQGTNNVSKTMTAYSQIYDIVKKVLPTSTPTSDDYNTVSIISFNGNQVNRLAKSSKQLGYTGMVTTEEVYEALFNTDNGYDDGGVTNWSAGLSRAYYVLKDLQSMSDNKQVVIFLSDGAPTYYSAVDGAVSVSPTDNEKYHNQVNGLDWARAIKGDTDKTYTVRHYTSSYYKITDDGTTTYDFSTQSVVGLGVEIHGILVGTENEEHRQNMYKITNLDPSLTISSDLNADGIKDLIAFNNRTNYGTNMTALSKSLTAIISRTSSEDYTIVVPFDNNFVLDTSTNVTISLLDDNGNVLVDTNADGEELKAYSFNLTADTWKYNVRSYRNYGRIKYDSTLNRIIWDLSTHTDYGYTTSSSYNTYQLTVTLELMKGGYTTLGETTSMKYYAVSDNSDTTSKNGHNSSSAVTGLEYGAYAYMNTPSYSNNEPNDPTEDDTKLMNIAPAIYLPVVKANIWVYKKDDNGNGLTGAKFKVYNENFELMQFYERKTGFRETTYEYYDGGEVKENYYEIVDVLDLGTTYSYLIIDELREGTYYITEIEYPETEQYTYVWSEKNETVQITPSGEDTAINCIKFEIDISEVSDTTNNSMTIYNTPIAKIGRIEGYKVDENGVGLAGAKIGLYSEYPNTSSVPLVTSITNEDGVYSFSVKATGIYYIKEIEAPKGYEYSSTIKTVNVTSLESTTVVTSNLVNRKMAKIIVHVDSSDYKKDGFTYALNSNTSYAFTGTTGEDGIYIFEVPITYNGNYPLTYTIEQTETPNDYYLTPEFSFTSFEDENAVIDTSFSIGEVEPGSETHIYVYNPSIKVTVNNYDGDDKITPLSSDISVNDVSYSTDENGSFTTNEWFGIGSNVLEQTKVEDGYSLLAEPVDFTITTGSIEKAYDENGQRYYRHYETIYNTGKLNIPPTGGAGTIVFTSIAILCFSAAIAMAVYLKRRKVVIK